MLSAIRNFILLSFGFVLIAYLMQQKLLLNADVAWLAEAAKRLLAGGSYHQDFFEINPPMTLYIYVPAILISKLFSLSVISSIRIYTFLLTFLSTYWCYQFSKIIFNSNPTLPSLFSLSYLIVSLILPTYEFAQREHIYFILSFPYLMLVGARLSNYIPSKRQAGLIGALAGIGFCIKPYFFINFFLLELYYALKVAKIKLRVESSAVIVVLLSYIILLLTLHQDYLQIIVPLAKQYYYQDNGSPWRLVFLNDITRYFYFSLFLFLWCYHEIKSSFATLLLIVTVGFYLSYLCQHTYWYYHVLPLFSATLLLNVYLLSSVKKYLKLLIPLLFYAVYLYLEQSYIALSVIYYAGVYYLGVGSIILWVLYAATKNIKTSTLFTSLIIGINFFLMPTFGWANVLICLMVLLALPGASRVKAYYGAMFFAGLILLTYPIYYVGYLYYSSVDIQKIYAKFIAELATYASASVYFFTDSDQYPYPALHYTRQTYASRFSCFGGLSPERINTFTQAIVEDFQNKKPQVVLVDVRAPNSIKHLHYYGNTQPDYISLFSSNTAFAQIWQHYQYVKTIDGQPLYKFKIYTSL